MQYVAGSFIKVYSWGYFQASVWALALACHRLRFKFLEHFAWWFEHQREHEARARAQAEAVASKKAMKLFYLFSLIMFLIS